MDQQRSRRFFVLLIGAAVAVALPAFVLGTWGDWQPGTRKLMYSTVPVTRGDVLVGTTATGTLNPVNVISVGTQVSGAVSKILVNYNDRIEAGQLLAEIDPAVYKAAANQSRANLKSAEATLQLAQRVEARQQQLLKDGLISRQDFDTATQNRIVAEAQTAIARAQLEKDVSNLGYTRIYAPTAGVVLAREVAVGQTVVASFESPTLFKIAQDLGEMLIECSVPEADIGALRRGQHVTFTVDAFADKTYIGTLRQIRLVPKLDQGVVMYSVIVDVKNSDGSLLPGMTALVTIVRNERRNVLRVPSVALSYRPSGTVSNVPNSVLDRAKVLYVLRNGKAVAIAVTPGLSDGENTEVVSGAVSVGDRIVVADQGAS